MLTVPLLAAAGDKVELLLCRDPAVSVAARHPIYTHSEEDESDSSTPIAEVKQTSV